MFHTVSFVFVYSSADMVVFDDCAQVCICLCLLLTCKLSYLLFYCDDKALQRDDRSASQRTVDALRRHDEHCWGKRSQSLQAFSQSLDVT